MFLKILSANCSDVFYLDLYIFPCFSGWRELESYLDRAVVWCELVQNTKYCVEFDDTTSTYWYLCFCRARAVIWWELVLAGTFTYWSRGLDVLDYVCRVSLSRGRHDTILSLSVSIK